MFIAELTASDLRRDDPFVAAVIAYLDDLGARAGASAAGVHAFLAGGLAVRCYSSARTTADIDMFFVGGRVLIPPNTTVVVQTDRGTFSLAFDHQYTPDFGLLHPGYAGRAVTLSTPDQAGFAMHVLHPVDLAITKVARFQDHDRSDIGALAQLGAFDTELFSHLAEEAMAYAVGDPAFVRLNLRDAAEVVSAATESQS